MRSETSEKQKAEMGQREAIRPSSGTREANTTVNRLQEKIRAIVRKSVAMWRDPQTGRPHLRASRAGSWRGSYTQPSYLLSTDATCNTGREPTLEGYK